jgi:hypothetical protein
VKVSDFGLARAFEDGKDYYRMKSNCFLPVRWMAIESIVDSLFTRESDIVWNPLLSHPWRRTLMSVICCLSQCVSIILTVQSFSTILCI